MNQRSNILIVDDSKTNVRVLGNYLQEHSYNMAIAFNGCEALDILQSFGSKTDSLG